MKNVPEWFEDRKYIYTGYIEPGFNIIKIFFTWHNQTMNIYTQLIPFFIFWGIALYEYSCGSLRTVEPLVFHFTCIGFSLQLLTSTFAHAFSHAHPKVHHLCWKLDYFGIAGASFVAIFLLERDLGYSSSAMLISFGVFTMGLMLLLFKTKQMQFVILPILFVWVAILAISKPILYHHPFPFWLAVGSMTIGILFYMTHFPECIKPGAFDIIGASHSWWHICTSIQMGATYYICWILSIDRYERPDIFLYYLMGDQDG